jgi:hypothetical protein
MQAATGIGVLVDRGAYARRGQFQELVQQGEEDRFLVRKVVIDPMTVASPPRKSGAFDSKLRCCAAPSNSMRQCWRSVAVFRS